jgi:acyl-CoA synthetase (NDP forming)
VVLKGGRTSAGRTAAASHTAALASQQAVWQAAVSQAGALQVDTLDELTDMLVAFACAGPAHGPRVAILGGAGGETVETADICNEAGLDVAPLPQEIREQLRETLPHAWDWVGNPIDGSILGWGRFEAMEVIRLMAASPAYDLVFANVRGVEHMLNQEDGGKLFRKAINLLKELGTNSGKATMLVMGEPEFQEKRRWTAVMNARRDLAAAGVAIYPDISRAARALGRYVRYVAERQEAEEGGALAA